MTVRNFRMNTCRPCGRRSYRDMLLSMRCAAMPCPPRLPGETPLCSSVAEIPTEGAPSWALTIDAPEQMRLIIFGHKGSETLRSSTPRKDHRCHTIVWTASSHALRSLAYPEKRYGRPRHRGQHIWR